VNGRRLRYQDGFTLVELLLAMVILLVGMLGTITLVDAANQTTSRTRARVVANNLVREVIEQARMVDYDSLTAPGVAPALRAAPALADSTPDSSDWTIVRSATTFTLNATACTYDDAKDSVAPTRGATICASSPTVTPATDSNADDFRRVDLQIAWTVNGRANSVRQTALVINPSGGLGPGITSFLPNGRATPSVTVADADTTSLDFGVRTTPATAVRWAVDDAVSAGDANGGVSVWSFTWSLGTALDAVDEYVGDGTYQLTAQAFDGVGVPGDLRVATAIVNRSPPIVPTGLAGGRNTAFSSGPIVDLQWNSNLERDINGYRVYRDGPDGAADTGDDVMVCPAAADDVVSSTACSDTSPPPGATSYHVKAVDLDNAGATRSGGRSALLAVGTDASSATAFAAGSTLSATVSAGLTRLDWTAADAPVSFYRIYRDSGSGFADRYARTESSCRRSSTPRQVRAPSTRTGSERSTTASTSLPRSDR
jgi:prepilin-type N-terminal cleavage/methylation domain-containing protein